MSVIYRIAKRFYGSGRVGMPLGINLRKLIEDVDFWTGKFQRFFDSFTFNHQRYRYCYCRYNASFNNERIVEVPLIERVYRQYPKNSLLEIGNVLHHYGYHGHTVVDKYERYPDVINQDIVDYKPGRRFDLIISISTLEHVGFDEPDKDSQKIFKAIDRIRSLLKPGGICLFTVPLNANPHVDEAIKTHRLGLLSAEYLYRLNEKNQWQQCSEKEAFTHQYNHPFPYGNAIMIASFSKA